MAERDFAVTPHRAAAAEGLIERRRMLPAPGEISVKEGDSLAPDDVIGWWETPGQIVALEVAQALGVPPARVGRYLLAHEGDVAPQTLIAQRRGLLRRWRVLAGLSGTILGLEAGTLFLRTAPQRQELRAGLPGRVSQVFPGRGVVIRTAGACIRGIWGRGGTTWGPLILAVQSPAEPLRWNLVEASHRGSIVVGGVLEEEQTLLRAALFGVQGLIAGSLNPALRPLCERVPYPIVITEGYGQTPMAEPIFNLLRRHQEHRAILSGRGLDPAYGPEVLIPTEGEETSRSLALRQPIAIGDWVRLTEPSLLGTVGLVEAIPQAPQPDAAGRLVYGAYVRLPDRRRVFVPLTNMEYLPSTIESLSR